MKSQNTHFSSKIKKIDVLQNNLILNNNEISFNTNKDIWYRGLTDEQTSNAHMLTTTYRILQAQFQSARLIMFFDKFGPIA